jgi:oxygen-dependent protoporphyrinogen oxidase
MTKGEIQMTKECPKVEGQIALKVAVIGGGISGLSAALRLTELEPGCRLTVWEKGARPGGVLWTLHEDGFQVEQSADNFITTVPWGVDLCKRLGLGGELMQTNPAFRQTCVVRRGRLYKLPDGFLMMAPTRMWPLAVTPILSPWGKVRAALEYFLPPRRTEEDESIASFVRRRLGNEVFERLVEPLVSAVYAADMERLSLVATLSQFREMELAHGSLIRAMRRRMRQRPKGESSDSGARYSLFVTPRNGLSSMVDALAARLPQGALRLKTAVERLEPTPEGWLLSGPGLPEGPGERTFDAVILATSATTAADLLTPVDAELGRLLGGIEHSGTAIVSVGYRRNQIAHPLNSMGAVIPAIEKSPILALSFSSQKYAHRAPEGHVLLRVFAGGARHPELAEMPDDDLLPLMLAELNRLLGVRGDPVYCRIAHWPRTMPQYHIGHRELVERIKARAGSLPGLALAGNYLQGVGIPHCICTGQDAAERVLGQR